MPKRKPTSDLTTSLSRFNAVRHGLAANAPIIPGESLDDWTAHREAIVDDLAPVGAFETALAEMIATLFWDRQRVSRYERESILLAIDGVEAAYAERPQEYAGQPRSIADAEQRLE